MASVKRFSAAMRRATTLLCMAGMFGGACAAEVSGADYGELGNLTLQAAETLLIRHNREILAAQRQTEAAQAQQIIAGQRPNPTFSYEVDQVSPSQGIGAGSLRDKNMEQTIRLEQLIERGGKRNLRIEQAGFDERASRAERANTIRQQRLALNAAYSDLLLAQEKLRIQREIAELAGRSGGATERRLQAGDVSKLEASRIRIEAQRAQGDAIQAQADLARARLALATLIGAETRAAQIRAVDPWPEHAQQAEAAAEAERALALRPDVQAAQARLRAADAARRLARSSRTRDVTVGVGYTHFPFNPELNTGSGNTVGVSVSVPLFVWHANEGEIRRAEVDHAAAGDALERVRAGAHAEIEQARSDLAAASERAARFNGAVLDEARAAAEAVEFAYRNGAVGVTDLLDARRTYRSIQIEAAAARNDYAKALAALRLATVAYPDAEAEALPAGASPR